MFDVEFRVGRNAQALTGNLDDERFLRLERVGKASQLRDELGAGVGALEIPLAA